MMREHIPHEAGAVARLFTCWPSSREYWPAPLEAVWPEYGAFLRAVIEPGADGQRLPLTIFANTAEAEAVARQHMGARAAVVRLPYGDVWTRDTGPVFRPGSEGGEAVCFRFNGWGGKYVYPGDAELAKRLACHAGTPVRLVDLVGEGGALEFDGEGTVLTTRQCLLNPNRNPGLSEAKIEARLKAALGVEKVLWIDRGLAFDHTDGHIDNIVRFVKPGVVVCQAPNGPDDPQAAILIEIHRQLETMIDAQGRQLQVHIIPSPGRVVDDEGEVMPASYMNWVMGPRNLVVPVYGQPGEQAAMIRLQNLFPTFQIAPRRANAILSGGGGFHCVTCHMPGGPE